MDEHIQILQSLDSIYSLLVKGTQIETSVAGLIFIAHNTLKHYWFNIPDPTPAKRVLNRVDEIEEFLKKCAELD